MGTLQLRFEKNDYTLVIENKVELLINSLEKAAKY